MRPLARVLLHMLLAVSLLTGNGLSWGAGANIDTGPSDPAATVASDSVHVSDSDCHSDADAASSTLAGGEEKDCCDREADCEHENCRCLCPSPTLALPVRISALPRNPLPLPRMTPAGTVAFQLVSDLLRPPRA